MPISRLDEAILGTKADIVESGLTAPVVGHVGDGNFHTVILVPPEPDGLPRAWALDRKIVGRALALGGSCSGEHGIGIGKREFLETEHGPEALAVMRSVKQALDPRGIMKSGENLLELTGGAGLPISGFMRVLPVLAAIGLIATPLAARAQAPPPATPPQVAAPSEGQQAGQAFGNAGSSLADAARNTWHGLQHGWEATKEGARAGWNTTTHGGTDSHPADTPPAR